MRIAAGALAFLKTHAALGCPAAFVSGVHAQAATRLSTAGHDHPGNGQAHQTKCCWLRDLVDRARKVDEVVSSR